MLMPLKEGKPDLQCLESDVSSSESSLKKVKAIIEQDQVYNKISEVTLPQSQQLFEVDIDGIKEFTSSLSLFEENFRNVEPSKYVQ